MTQNSSYKIFIFLAAIVGIMTITSCGSAPVKSKSGEMTLADIDRNSDIKIESSSASKNSKEDIRQAYQTYFEKKTKHQNSRKHALSRLAQLELELSNRLTKESDDVNSNNQYDASVQRTITLLETSLRDYPDAKDNDTILYQLAQAYDSVGEYQKSLQALSTLTTQFKKSPFFAESQFRLAEAAFARGDYIVAEDAYTEVILSLDSDAFYENALFKRGWTRYKQSYYKEALDDYFDSLKLKGFETTTLLDASQKSQFFEYFRAIGLAFSYHIKQESIEDYLDQRAYGSQFTYDIYDSIGNIYFVQKRYFDAAHIFSEYVKRHPNTQNTVLADLKVLSAWKAGGFVNQIYESAETIYLKYQPASNYWVQFTDKALYSDTQTQIREYIVQIASHYHATYRKKGRNADLQSAKRWYQRYLEHYGNHANKDDIYNAYGELLFASGDKRGAFKYLSLAAYNEDIVLDKGAAYSTIVLSHELYKENNSAEDKHRWLDTYLSLSQRYIELYTDDEKSNAIASSAAEVAFNDQRYNQTIDIVNSISGAASESILTAANNLKARSYLELGHYEDAETIYRDLSTTSSPDRATYLNSLALAIYRQGEQQYAANNLDLALSHFTRIAKAAPSSPLAATGLFDAMTISMQNARWVQAISLGNAFQTNYPKDKRRNDISKKLSLAYINSNQKTKAAQQLESVAQFEQNIEIKKAAQWQAAELYESKGNSAAAINAYRTYAHTYPKPFATNMEAMYKLTNLYQKTGEPQKRYFWQNKIRTSDRKAASGEKTDRTTYITSSTVLNLAKESHSAFSRRKLKQPLQENLRRKKADMQTAVKLYGEASAFGIEEITTEATSAIGDIYLEFSQALLSSERPSNLNDEERVQYDILLEDQAFPFEEKAIEFYEVNLARTQDDLFNAWIINSLDKLQTLFPVRYQREGKVEIYAE